VICLFQTSGNFSIEQSYDKLPIVHLLTYPSKRSRAEKKFHLDSNPRGLKKVVMTVMACYSILLSFKNIAMK
jgi:hypothetical protein